MSEQPDVLGVFQMLKETVEQLDEKLDSVSGGNTAGKRKITSDLVTAHEDFWKPGIQNMVTELRNTQMVSDEQRVASFYGIVRLLTKEFGDEAEKFIDALVPEKPETPETTLTESEIKEIQDTRRESYNNLKVLGNLVVQCGLADSLEDLDMPEPRKGAVGPRGKRALSYYEFEVNGTTYKKLPEVAEALGYNKVSEVTKAFKDADVNTTKPPRVFKVTMKNGAVLTASDTRSDEERGQDEVITALPDEDETTTPESE